MEKFPVLLPHYKISGENLLYLDKRPVNLTLEEIDFIRYISGKEDPSLVFSQGQLIDSLIRKGLITLLPIPSETSKSFCYLVVAAHSDDAALSMGGTLLQVYQNTEINILNVFSTCGFTVIPELLVNPEEITYYNNEEEKLFARKINANLELMHLPESYFRYPRWNNPLDLEKDEEIYEEIRNKLRGILRKEYTHVFFPLGIGNHPDHLLLNSLAHDLFRNNILGHNQHAYLYEDLPYAAEISPYQIKKHVASFHDTDLYPVLFDITMEIDDKMDILRIYQTQYFPENLEKVREYAKGLNPSNSHLSMGHTPQYFERFWALKRQTNGN